MTKKTEPEKNILEIEITGNQMHRLLALIKTYSDAMEDSDWDFYKNGINMYSMDLEYVSAIQVAVGKEYFEKFKVKKEFFMGLNKDTISKIMGICRDAKENQMWLRIPDDMEQLKIKYGNVNRKIGLSFTERTYAKPEEITKIYKNSKTIGTLKVEELRMFLKASATWTGDADRAMTITKNKKNFEIVTAIEDKLDDVILNLDKITKKKFKDDKLKLILICKNINTVIKQMDRLTDEVTLRGESDYPMIIMNHDQNPEKFKDFKHKLNFWYMIAPRIKSD